MTEKKENDSIQKFIDVYLFKEFSFPKEDIIVEQIKRCSLDELYSYSTKYNDSILHIATYFNKHKIVDALLEKKMYVDYPNYHNETPLHYAACYYRTINDTSIMDKLIKHGANINAITMSELYKNCNIGNFTPLKYAINHSCLDAVECLVKNGAYVTLHSISKCKRYIQEHMFSEEDYLMLIRMKWSYMKDEYEKKLDENLNVVICHQNNKHQDKYIPKDLSNIIRSFMGYDEKEIEQIIREIERK